jgi:hypothetical protein
MYLTGLIVLVPLPFKDIRFENRIRITPDDGENNNLGASTFRIDRCEINPARFTQAVYRRLAAIADELHQSLIASRWL